ncbi:MAG: sigma-54-dependent Fis family transcriptional regulator [Acidobacteria bacterium]|nr:sigma-54-dependent Fis family transcriptional regulator [Acidobacteriota bacterium]MBP8274535.1 sigma-54-dependent Fis family transcriptional regulator [Acidobacteriota bacterium]
MESARIAIVDDDELFVEYLSVFLRSRGYGVVVFSSGQDLLQALASAAPPNLIMLDVLMPRMGGLETLRVIRSSYPRVPVIMVSGQQLPATIVDAVRLGAVDYVVKPSDVAGVQEAALEAAICRAIERVAMVDEVARLSALQPDEPDGTQPCWQTGYAMEPVMTMIERVADSDVSVLLTGESGVGKEVVARELHRRSSRRARPFVKVNCAALPAELLESELFGHERGAFTGAQNPRVGKFEFANGGTLMLDEIGEMPIGLQAKLLHVLQDGEITKLGSNRAVPIQVRVVAATNRDLHAMIQNGEFRADLFYRLQVIEIRVPALRDRREEIPALIDFFLRRYSTQYGRPLLTPAPTTYDALVAYTWPGNIRELENRIKRYVILRDESVLTTFSPEPAFALAASPASPTPMAAPEPRAESGRSADSPPPSSSDQPERLPDVARAAALIAERRAIRNALERFQWNRTKAAQWLGVSYKTLLGKMKECGISDSGTDR